MKIGLAVIALLLSAPMAMRLDQLAQEGMPTEDELRERAHQQAERWNPRLFQLLSFGQLPAAIDLVLLRFLGETAIHRVTAARDLDLVTDLDPAFFEVYYSGVNYLAVVLKDRDAALALAQKGEAFRRGALKTYPQSFRDRFWKSEWSLPFLLGYLYLFEFEDLDRAAENFSAAGILPGAPEYLRKLSERLRKPGGKFEVAIKVVEFMLLSQDDPRPRQHLLRRLSLLKAYAFLDEVQREFDGFRAQRGHGAPSAHSKLPLIWAEFKMQKRGGLMDPFGGRLELDSSGKIVTETQLEPVFGLGKREAPLSR